MRRNRHIDGPIDSRDAAILNALGSDARIALKTLAQRIGLSAPSTAERVRRLEESGTIEGYHAHVSAAAVGFSLGVYIRIKPLPGKIAEATQCIIGIPEIVLCERITGEDCFIAKAFVRSVEHLEKLINQLLPYATTHTSVVQSAPVPPRLPPFSCNDMDNSRKDRRG